MARKKNNKDEYKILYAVGAGIVILMLVVNFIISRINNKKTVDEINEETANVEDSRDNMIDVLQDMEERDRMEFYFGEFLDYIEDEEYEKAYDLLYDEFKNNYFPTLESFTEYVQKTFSEMTSIEHENIERNGDVYVLWINISDAINGRRNEKKKMNIVIKENDYNDFVMSFSVI